MPSKKKKPLTRTKGFDTRKTKPKHKKSAGQKPRKKASKAGNRLKASKAHVWKPPPIFAANEDLPVVHQSEATALKKKVFEHLSAHITIRHTATATTIDEMIEEEKNKSESVSSVFLVNIGWVVDKYLQWKYLMPRVMPFYAVKSNPDINILRTLKMLGAGFDCASEAELAAVKKLGALSENIIFANPCKGKTHIRYAKQCQVPMMTFDNPHEVDKIYAIYPTAKLVLRILPDDKYSLMPFGKKFGASWEESKALVLKCKEVKADLIGVSFHVGSGCMDAVAYEKAIELAKEVFDFAAEHGFKFTLLDIGGGFPGTDQEAHLKFEQIAKTVSPLLDKLFPKGCGVRIIGEPGRFFCSGSSTLAVVVNSKRRKNAVAASADNTPAHEEDHEGHDDDAADGEDENEDYDEEEEGPVSLHTSQSAPDLLTMERELELGLEPGLHDELDPGAHDDVDDSQSYTEEEGFARNPLSVVSTDHEFLYYLSDGVYGSFNNIIFDHAKPHPVLLEKNGETQEDAAKRLLLYKSRLFGPTCDSIDVICDCVELPELEIGDWLLFPQMGAYTVAAASSFNGFAPPNSTYIMSYDDEDTAGDAPHTVQMPIMQSEKKNPPKK